MPSTITSRIDGLTTSVAVKPPIKIMATAALTLSGEQTINSTYPDGSVVTETVLDGDRVGVNGQADKKLNGIYVCRTTAWERAKDFDGSLDAVYGTLVTDSVPVIWRLITPIPVLFGTSNIEFETEEGFNQANMEDLANSSDPLKGAALVGYDGGTVKENLDYRAEAIGIVPSGVDQTAELVAYLAALGAGYKGMLLLPYGIKFDRKSVTSAIPVGVVIFDISQYANDSPGETNKAVGFMSSDVAENDTHFQVSSGHHAIQYFNNYATSGTTSASERKASVLWGAGNFQKNPSKEGPRGILAAQFTKESGLDYWIYTIRSLAPWLAAHAEYEDWTTGETVAVGVYRRSGNNHYISTTSGTTGATAPSHTSGTVSDGAVSWQWVDSAFRTMYMIDQYGRVAFNAATNVAQMNHKTQVTDPLGPNNSHHQRATGVSGDIFWRPFPTDASSVEQAQPYIRSGAATGTRFITAAGSAIVSFDNAGSVRFNRSHASDWATAADGDTTPSVSGVSTLRLNNTAATSITALDDAIDGQRVRLVAQNANTTIVHSSTLMLTGSVNLTLTPWSSIDFEKVPNSISARWIEVARSIK